MPILISQQSQSKSTIFQSLMISLHSVLTLVLCWGTLVMAGCCLRYRLLVLGVPVLAPLAHNNDWDSRERREGGGSHHSPIQRAGRPNPTTLPDTGAVNTAQTRTLMWNFHSLEVDYLFLGECYVLDLRNVADIIEIVKIIKCPKVCFDCARRWIWTRHCTAQLLPLHSAAASRARDRPSFQHHVYHNRSKTKMSTFALLSL